MNNLDPSAINVLALIKGEEKYVFLYPATITGLTQARLALGKFAEDPELSFSWADAEALGQKMMEQMEAGKKNRIGG